MAVVITLWVLAMVAGLRFRRAVVAAATGATLLAFLILHPTFMGQPAGWLQLVAFSITPWLLQAQRIRHEKRVKRLQARETVKLQRLNEREQSLGHLHAATQRLESHIAQITNLYQITKETAHALRVEELVVFSLGIVPRLLDVHGVRVIDVSGPTGSSVVFRARRVPDGRLLAEPPTPILPFEQAILDQAIQAGRAAIASVQEPSGEESSGVSRIAWAPLWGEQQPIGILMADDLPPAQLGTLSIVANQLSLQLARVHLYQAVESMAITDTLTGLFVRRFFMELATEELLRAKRHGLACTCVLVDLDEFKTKNDTYGHLVGDVVLREVAQVMRRSLRGIDLIARYGGEEFILLLIETGPEAARPVAERLRQLVEAHSIRAYDETLKQTVSLGLASFPDDGHDLQQLIAAADEALYAAKRAGRNQVVRWAAQGSRLKSEGSVEPRLSSLDPRPRE